MASSLKSISITYDAINENNTFTGGDVVSGRVAVVLAKESKIKTLLVKARGKGKVQWIETHDQNTLYQAKEKYLKLDDIIISGQKGKEVVLAAGSHVFPFTFQIPQGNMPSSFKGAHGKVEYKLEAKLSRCWRIPSKSVSMFTFVSKPEMSVAQLMSPQCDMVRKDFFLSGSVSMNATVSRMGYMQGERLKVTVEIDNSSSHKLVPRFSVSQKQSFFAGGLRTSQKEVVLKEAGKPIASRTWQTLTQELSIPHDLPVSILNCRILRVEYKLQVLLGVPWGRSPEIKFPLVVFPAESLRDSMPPSDVPEPWWAVGHKNQEPSQPASGPPAPHAAPGESAAGAATLYVCPPPSALWPCLSPPPPYSAVSRLSPQSHPAAPPPYSALEQYVAQTHPGMPPLYPALGQLPARATPGANTVGNSPRDRGEEASH
ncbi:arrestin domain-containing protein 3-like [Brienomyrus brachyistius]|uniref:arrestin domain-containing protein 3-like n=1 Tax=Brienomyrus brachyistius TaxID=42636 RepID=UPI0020B34F87|nr:arrestin domain-containing protein 3-like [Brienomyrus brachyistius]